LIDLAQDKDNWRAVKNMVIKIQVLQMQEIWLAEEILTSQKGWIAWN
jgi:hypothetical protein